MQIQYDARAELVTSLSKFTFSLKQQGQNLLLARCGFRVALQRPAFDAVAVKGEMAGRLVKTPPRDPAAHAAAHQCARRRAKAPMHAAEHLDRKSTRLNSSHVALS